MEYSAIKAIDNDTAPMADFAAPVDQLERAVNCLAVNVLAKKPSVAVFGAITLAPFGGRLAVMASNSDVTARIYVDASQMRGPLAVSIDGAALRKFLAKLDAKAEILFQQEGSAIMAYSGRAKCRFKCFDLGDVPMPYKAKGGASFTLPASAGARIGLMQGFIGGNYSTSGITNCLHIQADNLAGQPRLIMAASNGDAIAMQSYAASDTLATQLDNLAMGAESVKAIAAISKYEGDTPLSWQLDAKGKRAEITMGDAWVSVQTIGIQAPKMSDIAANAYVAGDSQPLLLPELNHKADMTRIDKVTKGIAGPLSWEKCGNYTIARAANDPDFFAAMADGDGRKGYDVDFSDGKRKANEYLQGIAAQMGLLDQLDIEARAEQAADSWSAPNGARAPYSPNIGNARYYREGRFVMDGNRVLGLTVAATIQTPEYVTQTQCWQTLTMRDVKHPSETIIVDGSYSIIMPRERAQISASVEMSVDGETYPVAVNSGGKIHISKDTIAAVNMMTGETVKVQDDSGAAHYVLKSDWNNQEEWALFTCNEAGQFADSKNKALPGCGKALLRRTLRLYGEPAPVQYDQPQAPQAAPLTAENETSPIAPLSAPIDSPAHSDGTYRRILRSKAHERAIHAYLRERLNRYALASASSYARKMENERELAFEQLRVKEAESVNIQRKAQRINTKRKAALAMARQYRNLAMAAGKAAQTAQAMANVQSAKLIAARPLPAHDPATPPRGADIAYLNSRACDAAAKVKAQQETIARMQRQLDASAAHIEEMAIRCVRAEAEARRVSALLDHERGDNVQELAA